MEEVHGIRVTAVLAADSDYEARPGCPALPDRELDELPDAFAVDRLERRDAEDAQLQVLSEERGLYIIPGEAPGHLSQVVRAEGEELGAGGDRVRGQRPPGHLDHRADGDVQVNARLRLDLPKHLLRQPAGNLHLLDCGDERGLDLRARILARPLELRGGMRDRAHLHAEQAGDDQVEPDAAQAEHRVLLVHPADLGEHPLVPGGGLVALQGDPDRQVCEVGEELVQRRVDRPDRYRQAVHGRQDLREVAGLQRLEGGQCALALRIGLGQDEVLDQLAALAQEHVLGTDQAYPFGPEPACPGGVRAVVRVGEHAQPAPGVGVGHDPVHRADELAVLAGVRAQLSLEVAHDRGRYDRYLAEVDLTAGAVDGDDVALGDRDAARCGEIPGRGVHVELLGAADAGLAHAAGDHGRVAGLAAAAGQYTLGGDHAVQVVWVGLAADQDGRLSRGRNLGGTGRVEDGLTDSRAGGCAHAGCDPGGVGTGIERGEHQPDKLGTSDSGKRLVHIDE